MVTHSSLNDSNGMTMRDAQIIAHLKILPYPTHPDYSTIV